ncbi:MAG: PAS domain-containing protein [Rhodocyclales bacterium]|nr:PAS domain-containing protein [Rhodocyclales bacterium]
MSEIEDRLQLALSAANQGLWDWDRPSGRLYLSPSYYAMLGFRPGDFPATFDGWSSLLHPDDAPLIARHLSENASGGPDRFEHELRLRHRNGGWRWIHIFGSVAERDGGGMPVRLVGVNVDITERRAADLALQESEARFRAIFDSVQEGIFIHDIDTSAILATNRRACEMFGYGENEILAASIEDLSSGVPPYTQADGAYWMMRAAAGEPQSFEWHARRTDGSLFWVDINMRRAELAGQERVVVVVRDISRRKAQEEELRQNLDRQVQLNKRLEEAHSQLLQSEKLASIGQLAAGVAHELNNPIGFVHSNLGSLEGYLQDLFAIIDAGEPPAAASGGKALEAVQRLKAEKDYAFIKRDVGELMAESKDGLARVRKIVQDLKDFSRVGEAEWQWTDLHKGLDSTLNIVWNELKYKCTVKKEYGDLPEVHCLPSQLNQVFMNLLVNAGQAIVERGEITIRTGRDEASVWVAVSDTGAGIPQENLNRIFEPFFTTKPVGKGTGLGLSLSYGIVVKHRGRIEVESEVGKGSTFRVILPIDPQLEIPAAIPK